MFAADCSPFLLEPRGFALRSLAALQGSSKLPPLSLSLWPFLIHHRPSISVVQVSKNDVVIQYQYTLIFFNFNKAYLYFTRIIFIINALQIIGIVISNNLDFFRDLMNLCISLLFINAIPYEFIFVVYLIN